MVQQTFREHLKEGGKRTEGEESGGEGKEGRRRGRKGGKRKPIGSV